MRVLRVWVKRVYFIGGNLMNYMNSGEFIFEEWLVKFRLEKRVMSVFKVFQ